MYEILNEWKQSQKTESDLQIIGEEEGGGVELWGWGINQELLL